jgi:hypothetical protein
LVSNAVACWLDEPEPPEESLPNGNENGKKLGGFCWLSLAAAGAVPVEAGVEPLFCWGAGVGSGTLSAKAGASARPPHAVARIIAA